MGDNTHVPGTAYVTENTEGGRWRPLCSCGWWAPGMRFQSAAEDFARGHRNSALGLLPVGTRKARKARA